MSTLTQQEKTDFFIRVYFGTTNNNELIDEAIMRAYRDWNRTAHGLGQINSAAGRNQGKECIEIAVQEVRNTEFSRLTFDKWHEQKCTELKQKYIEALDYEISFGQAQKWLNMTLKYLFAIGDNKINGIETNYSHFHIPIDNIIQDKLQHYGIAPLTIRWSRIDQYETYMEYQNRVRERFLNEIPCDVEFRLFNQ